MGVSPNFTFQNGGIGETIERGVAGLLHALQAKKQLDHQEEEMLRQQKEYELQVEQQKLNKSLNEAQIAQMNLIRKEKKQEFMDRQKLLEDQKTGLEFYNQWVGNGANWADMGKVQSKIKDNVVAHNFFNQQVGINLEQEIMRRQGEPQPRDVAPSFSPVQGVDPATGMPVVGSHNNRTGQISMSGLGGRGTTFTEQERTAAGLHDLVVDADAQLRQLETPNNVGALTSRVPGVGNFITTSQMQQYNAALLQFIQNMRYATSGKAVTAQEAEEFRQQYGFQPGDSPETLRAKVRRRQIAVGAVRRVAGRALGQAPPMEIAPNPDETAERFRALQQADPQGWAEAVNRGSFR